MKTAKLSEFTRGWFIGDFSPTLVNTKDFEVAVKEYKKGDSEDAHYHKAADEITVVLYGKCSINGKVFEKGDIIWNEPGEVAKFDALEDMANVVVKIPSVKGDKYVVESQSQLKIPNGEPVSESPTYVKPPSEVQLTPREGQ